MSLQDDRAPRPPRIPFNRPVTTGRELDFVAQAVRSGWLSGGGSFTRKCEELLQEALGARQIMLTPSCTHALEMAAILLDMGPGDEFLVPSFGYVSTANAFVMRGARPVFVDIRPDTLNLDERLVSERITPRTKALVFIHYAGIGCEMDGLLEQARRHGLPAVEDNAHGLFGTYRGKPLGTFGALGCLSFHETKNLTCGEGGALILNDSGLQERAEIVRAKGTDRGRFLRGISENYTWIDLGSSYLPSELNAAFLYAQLEERDRIQSRRKRIWERYREGLSDWAQAENVQLPFVPEQCEPSYHIFYLILPLAEQRGRLIEYLSERGIQAVFHYLPLHLSAMGRRFGGKEGDCPRTESVCQRLVRLPLYHDLSGGQQDYIMSCLKAFPTSGAVSARAVEPPSR